MELVRSLPMDDRPTEDRAKEERPRDRIEVRVRRLDGLGSPILGTWDNRGPMFMGDTDAMLLSQRSSK